MFVALRERPAPNRRFGLVGASAALEAVRDQIERFGPEPMAIHVTGPSGAGKELVAQGLHTASGRAGKCMAVNAATLDRTDADAELFGATKGAYTGAETNRVGLFQAADGGTLFIDELAELDERVQAKLLRVLSERKLRPMGASETIKVDVRVVSAANRDLEEAVEVGDFREDLYWRLGMVSIDIPPLSARPLDVVPLVEHFARVADFPAAAALTEIDKKWPLRLARLYARALLHDWAGNARSAEAFAVRIAVHAREAVARGAPPAIPDASELFSGRIKRRPVPDPSLEGVLEDRDALVELVRSKKGNLKGSAELIAAATDRSVSSVRREIYRTLGRDVIASLRDDPG